jgi:hypothetical protein
MSTEIWRLKHTHMRNDESKEGDCDVYIEVLQLPPLPSDYLNK